MPYLGAVQKPRDSRKCSQMVSNGVKKFMNSPLCELNCFSFLLIAFFSNRRGKVEKKVQFKALHYINKGQERSFHLEVPSCPLFSNAPKLHRIKTSSVVQKAWASPSFFFTLELGLAGWPLGIRLNHRPSA